MFKLILSRKGFDSSFGGSPSPILKDGKIISFPIPVNTTNQNYYLTFNDLTPLGVDLGKLISDLAKPTSIRKDHKVMGKIKVSADDLAHLDPDICHDALPRRDKDWRGLFGQAAAAQGHLKNQEVGIGDIFLFYGLYQSVKLVDNRYIYDNTKPPIHLIWGWMQIGDKVDLINNMDEAIKRYPWASYHPHMNYLKQPPSNTLYVAKKKLSISGLEAEGIRGYGVFKKYDSKLKLTDPDSNKTSHWRLPAWMHRKLTYNNNRNWKLEGGYARLNAFLRGQEFVCKCENEQPLKEWLGQLFAVAHT